MMRDVSFLKIQNPSILLIIMDEHGLMGGQFRLESLVGTYTSAYCVVSLEWLPGEGGC